MKPELPLYKLGTTKPECPGHAVCLVPEIFVSADLRPLSLAFSAHDTGLTKAYGTQPS